VNLDRFLRGGLRDSEEEDDRLVGGWEGGGEGYCEEVTRFEYEDDDVALVQNEPMQPLVPDLTARGAACVCACACRGCGFGRERQEDVVFALVGVFSERKRERERAREKEKEKVEGRGECD